MKPGSSPRIAIIEDHADLLEETLFFLEHRGFSAWGAGSAEQFWKILHRRPVDIVLIDLGLPGEDGYSVLRYLNELGGYGLGVVTARGSERERLRALDLGADLFLVKPTNLARLAEQILQLAERIPPTPTNGRREPDVRDADLPAPLWHLERTTARLIAPSGQMMTLSANEYRLLALLVEEPFRVFDKPLLHDRLFDHVEEQDLHRIDVVLNRLRKKARAAGFVLPVRSIFGQGIVFAARAAQARD